MNYVPAPSGSTDYFGIYTGPWINWSHGPILGATITLSRRDAGLLISFVALFVSLTGTAFWRISSFVFHHRYSSEAPRDCLYHQRQAILRNSANGPSGLWNLWQTAWSWRGKTPSVYRRMLPILIFTIICLGAFTVAGVLSSKIATSTGAEALVTSPNCGIPDLEGLRNFGKFSTIYRPYRVQMNKYHASYAQRCYTNISRPEECRRYVRKQLSWSVNRNASCPFEEEFCRNKFGNLELDTGFLNSGDDFGRNDPPDQHFLYRSLLKCAPLDVKGYEKPYTYSAEGIEATYRRYYLGESYVTNFTYEYPELSIERLFDEALTSAPQDYHLGQVTFSSV